VWQSSKNRPATASPIVLEERIYVLGSPGILTCADARSGEVLWQLRLKGPFSSTPVAAGGHLYCINEEGVVQVVRLASKEGEKGEVVGTGELGQTVLASPAIAAGAIYVRADASLWRISRGEETER
jgi:outer membrane protein assembly factor BamB